MKAIKKKKKKKKEKKSGPERKQLSSSASAPSTSSLGSLRSETRFQDGYRVRHAREKEKEGPGAGATQEDAQRGCGSRRRRALPPPPPPHRRVHVSRPSLYTICLFSSIHAGRAVRYKSVNIRGA